MQSHQIITFLTSFEIEISFMLLLTSSKLEDAISFQLEEENNIRSAFVIHFEAGFWMQSTAN